MNKKLLRAWGYKFIFLRYLATLLIVFSVYIIIFQPFSSSVQEKPPSDPKKQLKTLFSEDLLMMNEFGTLNEDIRKTPYDIESLKFKLESSSKDFNELIKNISLNEENSSFIEHSKQLVDQRQAIIIDLNAHYTILAKAITYRLDDDLTQLDTKVNEKEIILRIDNATKALSSISKGQTLKASSNEVRLGQNIEISSSTKSNIEKSIACLESIKSSLPNLDSQQLKTGANNCERIYSEVRKSALDDLTNRLQTENANAYKSDLEQFIL